MEADTKTALNWQLLKLKLPEQNSKVSQSRQLSCKSDSQPVSSVGKTKHISKKSKDYLGFQSKKEQRGGNCIHSNSSKLLKSLSKKNLGSLFDEFNENYLQRYEISCQKENTILIPFCLFCFLHQKFDENHHSFEQPEDLSPVSRPLLCTDDRRSRASQTMSKILRQFIENINNSIQNSLEKANSCTENEKVGFHKKNVQAYRKIIHIIKQTQILSSRFAEDDHLQKPGEAKTNCSKAVYNRCEVAIVKIPQNSQSEEIQQKVINSVLPKDDNVYPLMGLLQNREFVNHNEAKRSLDLRMVLNLLEDLYEKKERDYQKAHDKVISVVLNEPALKAVYGIYTVDYKGLFLEAVAYSFRRNNNSKSKKSEQIFTEYWKSFQQIYLFSGFGNFGTENQSEPSCCFEMISVLLCASLADQKQSEILQEFSERISRQTKYLNAQRQCSSDQKCQNKLSLQRYYQKSQEFLSKSKDRIKAAELSSSSKIKIEQEPNSEANSSNLQNVQFSNIEREVHEFIENLETDSTTDQLTRDKRRLIAKSMLCLFKQIYQNKELTL